MAEVNVASGLVPDEDVRATTEQRRTQVTTLQIMIQRLDGIFVASGLVPDEDVTQSRE